MTRRMKISAINWIMWIGFSLLVYLLLPLKGIEPTFLEWLGIFGYSFSVFIILLPIAETLYPNQTRKDHLNRRAFGLFYILITSITFILIR